MSEFLGITRERIFSPGKVEDDRLILEAVAEALRGRGHRVHVISAEEPLSAPTTTTIVFTMSQGEESLATLSKWEREGIRVVNSVESILNCHRHRMVECFHRAAVPTPETIPIDAAPPQIWPRWLDTHGGWLKRGDVHAMEAGDVIFVRAGEEAAGALERFSSRGISRAVLQRHIDGTVVKFYGVGASFLAWYPMPDSGLDFTPAQIEVLGSLARSGARALGLEIYGGDCVATGNGGLQLIDLNDWPSYAPCRAAAAEAIAVHFEALSKSSD